LWLPVFVIRLVIVFLPKPDSPGFKSIKPGIIMKIAGGHPADLVQGTLPRTAPRTGQAHHKLPAIVGMALLAALALFAVSWLLPENLSQIALDLTSWCLVGALAAGTLFASVKLLESVLDL
jgi:hypothetical protein